MAAPDASFRTLAGPATAETTVRRSRFLARAVPVRDRDEAARFHAAEARAHVNPTHVVPALRLRDGTAWASDAGEPAGSAGAPLLAVLEGAALADVACVVVRWFGGVKLGAGGLVRAYGDALQAALDGAPTRLATPGVRLRVPYEHAHTAAVMRALAVHGAREVEHGYAGERPVVELALPAGRVDAFGAAVRDATRGAVAVERLADMLLYETTYHVRSAPMTERPAWHTDEYPELRAGPPWQMEEMIAAEPGLAAPILGLRAEGVGEAVRAAAGARQPVVVTGCGTSEHAALAVAAQLDEALRAVGEPGGWPEPRQAFEAALDPRPGGVLIGVSHEGATVPTVAALQAAGGLGAVTAAITGNAGGVIAQAADHVLTTPLTDRSWCHTVGYVSPILAGAAIAAALADRDVPVAAVEAHMTASAAVRPQAEAAADALHGVEHLLVVGGGVDSIPARELVLKVEEGLHLPAAFRDLETMLHGHFPATDERTGLVLIIAYRRGHAERVQRAVGLLRGARRLGIRTAAIVTPDASGALPAELTSAGRIELPHHRELPASLESLLSTALALQHLTLGLVHAAGSNPDLIRREQDAYREAAALSRPEGG